MAQRREYPGYAPQRTEQRRPSRLSREEHAAEQEYWKRVSPEQDASMQRYANLFLHEFTLWASTDRDAKLATLYYGDEEKDTITCNAQAMRTPNRENIPFVHPDLRAKTPADPPHLRLSRTYAPHQYGFEYRTAIRWQVGSTPETPLGLPLSVRYTRQIHNGYPHDPTLSYAYLSTTSEFFFFPEQPTSTEHVRTMMCAPQSRTTDIRYTRVDNRLAIQTLNAHGARETIIGNYLDTYRDRITQSEYLVYATLPKQK